MWSFLPGAISFVALALPRPVAADPDPRLELVPTWGVTVDDSLIQHQQLAAQLSYLVTERFGLGIEVDHYTSELREPYDLVVRQARRLVRVNRYDRGASLNLRYVALDGDATLLGWRGIRWRGTLIAGLGFTHSEVIPRDPALEPFDTTVLTPNLGASAQCFLGRSLALEVGLRDYVLADRFEAADRTVRSGALARDQAEISVVHNLVVQAGLSLELWP